MYKKFPRKIAGPGGESAAAFAWILTFLFSFHALMACAAPSEGKYSSAQKRIFLRWGEGQNEASLAGGPERERKGFTSFAIEGPGSILVLDAVRHCVQRVELTSGTLSMAGRGLGGAAICSIPHGGFHIFDGGKVRRWDAKSAAQTLQAAAAKASASNSDSEIAESVQVPAEEGYGVELFSDASGGVWLQGLDQNCRLISAPAGAASAEAAQAAARAAKPANGKSAGSIAPGRPVQLPDFAQPLYFRVKRLEGGRVRLLGLDAEEKDLVSVDVKLDGGRAGAALFKGADRQGRLYVEIERIMGDGAVNLEVHRYAPDGRRLAVFNLPNSYSTTLYKKTEIAPNGTVVQMLSSRKGIEFIEYGP